MDVYLYFYLSAYFCKYKKETKIFEGYENKANKFEIENFAKNPNTRTLVFWLSNMKKLNTSYKWGN